MPNKESEIVRRISLFACQTMENGEISAKTKLYEKALDKRVSIY
jgi:hypothetical protein